MTSYRGCNPAASASVDRLGYWALAKPILREAAGVLTASVGASLPLGGLLQLEAQPIQDVPLLRVESGHVDPLLHRGELAPQTGQVAVRRLVELAQLVLEAL